MLQITYDHMDDSQFTPDYEKNSPECKIDFYLPVSEFQVYVFCAIRVFYTIRVWYVKYAYGTICVP